MCQGVNVEGLEAYGTVTKVPDETDTVDNYMAIADTRLYKAKELGRNQVVTGD